MFDTPSSKAAVFCMSRVNILICDSLTEQDNVKLTNRDLLLQMRSTLMIPTTTNAQPFQESKPAAVHKLSGACPFTGNEKPFVPRGSLANVVPTYAQQACIVSCRSSSPAHIPQKTYANSYTGASVSIKTALHPVKAYLQRHMTSSLASAPQKFEETLIDAKCQPVAGALGVRPDDVNSEVRTPPLAKSMSQAPPVSAKFPRSILDSPLLKLPVYVSQQNLPVLQPISPRRQVQLELQAGMKPSFPSHVVLQQAAKKYVPMEGCPVVPGRPIRGRRDNDRTEGYPPRKIPEAHSHHRLQSLAAQDSAIVIPQDKNDENLLPLDLSTSAFSKVLETPEALTAQISRLLEPIQLDKLSVENVPAQNTSRKDYEQLWNQMASGTNDSIRILNSQQTKEKPSGPMKDRRPGFPNPGKVCDKGDIRSSVATTTENVSEQLAAPPPSPAEVFDFGSEQEVETTPSEGRGPSDTPTNAENNSSAATLPYGDEPCVEPLDLSCGSSSRLEIIESSTKASIREEESWEEWSLASLQVQGTAILPQRSEECMSLSPVETSDGLMDDVYEEDILQKTPVQQDISEGHSPETNESLQVHGNNIWSALEQHGESLTSSENSRVSDSEQGSRTPLSNKGADSPVLSLQNENISSVGSSEAGSPAGSGPMKWLDMMLNCARDGDLKALIADFIHAAQQETNTNVNNNDINSEEADIKDSLLNLMHLMVLVSNKLESLVKLQTSVEGRASRRTVNQAVSLLKSYQKSTSVCLAKLGALVFKTPARALGKLKTKSSGRRRQPERKSGGQKPAQQSKEQKTTDWIKARFATPKKLPSKPPRQDIPRKNPEKPESAAATTSKREVGKAESPKVKSEDQFGTSPEDRPLENKDQVTPEKKEEQEPQSTFLGFQSVGAVDLVTSTPIDGNRYWKRRMLQQKSGNSTSQTPSLQFSSDGEASTAESTKKGRKVPECERGLLSASYSFSDEDSPVYDSTLVWTPSCKSIPKIKLVPEKKHKERANKDKPCSYKRLKDLERKQRKPKQKKKPGKRKRSRGSPSSVSPPGDHTKKKTKQSCSPDSVVGPVVSSNRRHFPYQSVSFECHGTLLSATVRTDGTAQNQGKTRAK